MNIEIRFIEKTQKIMNCHFKNTKNIRQCKKIIDLYFFLCYNSKVIEDKFALSSNSKAVAKDIWGLKTIPTSKQKEFSLVVAFGAEKGEGKDKNKKGGKINVSYFNETTLRGWRSLRSPNKKVEP